MVNAASSPRFRRTGHDPYLLDLLGLTGAYSERDLESAFVVEASSQLQENSPSCETLDYHWLSGARGNVDQATHSKIIPFIRGIADDVLRDLFKRCKYPEVILTTCVTRLLDGLKGADGR